MINGKSLEELIAEANKAIEEANAIRTQAMDEATRTKEGASVYAEQVLLNLEQNLNQLHEIVKNGQVQLERNRAEVDNQMARAYAQSEY